METDKDNVIIYMMNSKSEIIRYGDTSYEDKMITGDDVYF